MDASLATRSPTRHRRRLLRCVFVAVATVGSLAFVSSLFHEDWHGGMPRGEYRISVLNLKGEPVSGAKLRGFSSETLISADSNGKFVLTQHRGGIQYGGSRWWLFWIIPMGDQPPEFVWEVSAEGYRKQRVTWSEFYELREPSTQPTVHREFDGNKLELPAYDFAVRLLRE